MCRREVHRYLASTSYDYVGSYNEDDLFIRKDLNIPSRSPVNHKSHLSHVNHHFSPVTNNLSLFTNYLYLTHIT